MSIKQGIKYDTQESARDILPFIHFHKLKVDEIRDPIDSYSMCSIFIMQKLVDTYAFAETFNQFFYRYNLVVLLEIEVFSLLSQKAEGICKTSRMS